MKDKKTVFLLMCHNPAIGLRRRLFLTSPTKCMMDSRFVVTNSFPLEQTNLPYHLTQPGFHSRYLYWITPYSLHSNDKGTMSLYSISCCYRIVIEVSQQYIWSLKYILRKISKMQKMYKNVDKKKTKETFCYYSLKNTRQLGHSSLKLVLMHFVVSSTEFELT